MFEYTNLFVNIMSVIAKLSNINQKTELELLNLITPDENIVSIYNNFGRKDFTDDIVWMKMVNDSKIKKQKEKDKKKNKSNRLTTGIGEFSGTSFNSQTTFVIKETPNMIKKRQEYYKNIPIIIRKDNIDVNIKYFKVKFFINGSIQIPGIIFEDFSDAYDIINILINMLQQHNELIYNSLKINIISMYSSMRNYKTCLFNNIDGIKEDNIDGIKEDNIDGIKEDNIVINLAHLKSKFDIYKNKDVIQILNNDIDNDNIYYMNRIDLNIEKIPGILIKIYKSSDIDFINKVDNIKNKNIYNEITIKILQKGKISIDSVNNINEAYDMLNFIKNYITDDVFIINNFCDSEYYTSDDFL
jgi:hypothetical protein